MATGEQSPTRPAHVRVATGLLAQVDEEAGREDRSRAKMMAILIREALEARRARRRK